MINKFLYSSIILFLLVGCGVRLKQPFVTQKARLGETTSSQSSILNDVLPVEPIVVGVYKFRDQTGQYKQIENGTSWSTAVTQGATTILLKSLEDSKWFTTIERENVSNLLNERQIIRSTRQQYDANGKNISEAQILPPLLFAGVILEGGVISYDTNIITGGAGARYFGIGGSTKYREDRITVYLRAISTSNGKILKTIYISKTILSQALSANVFKYVDVKRLLEVEVGVTQNEPKQLAVKEAIDKAVEGLIIEGIIDGLWMPKGGQEVVDRVTADYTKDLEEANKTKLFNRKSNRRTNNALGLVFGGAQMDGDYSNTDVGYNFKLNYKHLFNNHKFSLNFAGGVLDLNNQNGVLEDVATNLDGNLEFILLPDDNVSPFVYGGIGALSDKSFNDIYFKTQYGLGLEYMPVDFLGLRIYGEQNILFSDDLDGLIQGKRDDYFWRFGVGIHFYLGK